MQKDVIKTMSVLITTAFAFVAGTAWNSAIQAVIEEFIPKGSATWSLIIYAVIVTIIAVIFTIFIGRLASKADIDLDEK